ncbi:L,D-transpeptidase family protein [Haloferula sp. BvORR071]|uniref:L,D-transpeptidase family protein n=1 Tax=Haloferula sp. BvORR071 TaxID=1396141 RepID=UPI000554B595|nr:L,D-transpeptidase family protein [Haloferula sp. BvORR071]
MKARHLPAILLLPLVAASCGSLDGVTNIRGENHYMAGFSGKREHDWKSSPIPDDVSYWDGDQLTGPAMIKINLTQQKAFFYKGGVLAGVSKISTGKEGRITPSGNYKVQLKDIDHRSSSYGMFKEKGTNRVVDDDAEAQNEPVPPGCYYEGAPMFNFLQFAPGVGMHTGYLPGYAASHGCVRMPDGMAKKFFQNAEVGTPVIVER